MNFKKQQSGAALIMTVLIISIFSIAVLSVGRVLSSEIRFNSNYGSSEQAYWAAESGIEKSLLYLRENQEEPVLPEGASYETEEYLITNLENNKSTINSFEAMDFNSDDSYSLIKVYDEVVLNDTEYILEKDQGISLRPTVSDNLNIKYQIVDKDDNSVASNSIDCSKNRLYIRVNKKDGSFDTKIKPRSNKNCISGTVPLSYSASTDNLIQIKAFLQNSNLKMKLILTSASQDTLMGGRYIYLESIGYYRGVSKKVLAKIDREDITAPNIMDYLIFSNQSID
jgi:hypothetical protein